MSCSTEVEQLGRRDGTPATTGGRLVASTTRSPTYRAARSALQSEAIALGADAIGAYDRFVALIDDDAVRPELQAISGRADADASPYCREVAESGARSSAGCWRCCSRLSSGRSHRLGGAVTGPERQRIILG